MKWWQGTPRRLVQTNLREIDVPIDPAAYARRLAEMGANVALFNLGGIVANYPTRLPYQYHNPRLKEDIIGDLIRELHGHEIRFMGRFDFSKVHQQIGAEHPDWLYRDLQGEPVTYNGQVQCCINGAYQQECALAILAEAVEMYPLDGVFFNMIGYQTRDYSGVYHGICQCENCRARFFAFCGEALPRTEDRADPVYQHYLRFCDATIRDLFHRIRDTIKTRRADCAICTYTSDGVDILRSEANSGIRRIQPEFLYDASLTVRRARSSWPELAVSNAAVHFIDFPYRHAAVSPALTLRRTAQHFIHAGWLDYYVIGHLDEQHDRACLPELERMFHLHQQAESWLAGLRPLADVCVIEAGPANPARSVDEVRGLVTLLSEAHILYDVIEETALAGPDAGGRLAAYPLVIVPDMPYLSPALVSALRAYAQNGGRLLLTGMSGTVSDGGEQLSTPALDGTGIAAIRHHPHIPGTYFALSETDRLSFPHLAAVDWVPMDSDWLECDSTAEARTYLRFVPAGMYGPPEKCYYTEMTDHPGLAVNQAGNGVCAVIPWRIGDQYWRFPTHAVSGLFLDALDSILALPRSITVEAPPMVEISGAVNPATGALVIGLVNLSGQNGRGAHAPVPVHQLSFSIPPIGGIPWMDSLCVETLAQGDLPFQRTPDGGLTFTLPRLDLLDLIRVRPLS